MKIRTSLTKLGLLFLLMFHMFDVEPGMAQTDPRPLLMASMGNSLTAAALASFPLPETPGLSAEARVWEWWEQCHRPEVLVENKLTLSWASGRLIRSHAVFLSEFLLRQGETRSLSVLNVARSGDNARDIPAQAQEIASQMASGRFSELTYVTLFIGANDACSDATPTGTPDADMRAGLMGGFELLAGISQAKRIRVLVSGLPRIADLGLPEIRNHQTIFGLRCETVRNTILNFCNPLVTWTTEAEHQLKNQLVDAKNQLIQSVVAEAGARFPNLELFFTAALHDQVLNPGLLAADCFHANASGQQVISDALWAQQPWFKDLPESLARTLH